MVLYVGIDVAKNKHDLTFPELAGIVGNIHNAYLLTRYPSAQKIAHAHFDSLLKIKRLTTDKANKIREAARSR